VVYSIPPCVANCDKLRHDTAEPPHLRLVEISDPFPAMPPADHELPSDATVAADLSVQVKMFLRYSGSARLTLKVQLVVILVLICY
jgi:hypothetical protein